MELNAGVVACALSLVLFVIAAIVFSLMKGKAALLISGFNSLPARERERYDQEAMARDMRNSCCVWALVMAVGCALSYAVSPYAAIVAYVVWLVLLFKDVRSDASQAFAKYRKARPMTR